MFSSLSMCFLQFSSASLQGGRRTAEFIRRQVCETTESMNITSNTCSDFDKRQWKSFYYEVSEALNTWTPLPNGKQRKKNQLCWPSMCAWCTRTHWWYAKTVPQVLQVPRDCTLFWFSMVGLSHFTVEMFTFATHSAASGSFPVFPDCERLNRGLKRILNVKRMSHSFDNTKSTTFLKLHRHKSCRILCRTYQCQGGDQRQPEKLSLDLRNILMPGVNSCSKGWSLAISAIAIITQVRC